MGRHNLITILTDCDQIPSSLDTFTTDLSSEVPVPSELWRSSFPSASLWHSSEALRPEELPPSPSPSALDWGSLPLEPWAGHGSYGRQGWRPPRVCTSTCGLPAWSQSLTAAPRDAVLGTPSGHQTTLTWNADSSKTYVVQSLWGVCEFMSEKCSEHRLRYMIVTCCSAKRRTLRPHAPTASGRPLTLLFLWPMGGTCLWVLFSAVSPGRHAGPRLPLWSLQGLSSCLPFRPYPRLHPLSFVFSSAVSLPLVTRRLTHTHHISKKSVGGWGSFPLWVAAYWPFSAEVCSHHMILSHLPSQDQTSLSYPKDWETASQVMAHFAFQNFSGTPLPLQRTSVLIYGLKLDSVIADETSHEIRTPSSHKLVARYTGETPHPDKHSMRIPWSRLYRRLKGWALSA